MDLREYCDYNQRKAGPVRPLRRRKWRDRRVSEREANQALKSRK